MSDEMRQVDGGTIRRMETLAMDIGRLLKRACMTPSGRYGFCLFLFSFDGPEMTYISSADRESCLKMLQEFIDEQKKTKHSGRWNERN